jgi:hypothetical protein
MSMDEMSIPLRHIPYWFLLKFFPLRGSRLCRFGDETKRTVVGCWRALAHSSTSRFIEQEDVSNKEKNIQRVHLTGGPVGQTCPIGHVVGPFIFPSYLLSDLVRRMAW